MARYFSEVYQELRDYRGDRAFEEIILPWLEEDGAEDRDLLQSIAVYDPSAVGDASPIWLACPYALSRISDVLLLGLQPSIDSSLGVPWAHQLHLVNNDWPAVSRQEYLTLFTALGMTETTEREFDPFLHEIVEVEQTPDPGAPIEITEVVWPGLMLGEMLFNRAGVRVRAGAEHAQAGVADRFVLYSTFLRRYRATRDRSLGWGHASQWDTDFRRDYRTAEADHLNVDRCGDIDRLSESEDDDGLTEIDALLTPAERRELLRHRCLLRTPEAVEALDSITPDWDANLWPDNWRLTVPREL